MPMGRCLLVSVVLIMMLPAGAQQQSSLPDNPSPQPSAKQSSSDSNAPPSHGSQPVPQDSGAGNASPDPSKKSPDLTAPRSDRVQRDDLGGDVGESSSKDTQVDLSPPVDDVKKHPNSSSAIADAEADATGVAEFHPWDPHKAAKDVEIGDFYFKRKNYRAAEDRYREALLYKDNDAVATFRLGECLEKLGEPGAARDNYESYLKILPHGPFAEEARKSVERLKKLDSSPKPSK